MTPHRIFLSSSKVIAYGAVFVVLNLLAMAVMVLGQQLKPASMRDTPRVRRTARDARPAAARQRFLEMFARAYYPGRTGQLLIVPREGDFITRTDQNYAYMHGSPWAYVRRAADAAKPLTTRRRLKYK